MALILGVTGGIGSGKTTVCQIFKLLGIPVFEADTVAKKLLNSNKQLKNKVSDIFGDDILTPQGIINRKKLGDIVFKDKVKLAELNELVHPVVLEELKIWAEQKTNMPYIIVEAAILFESGFYKLTDYIIVVSAPENERIKRVMKRDGVSEDTVRERIKNQLPENKKQDRADIILKNDNRRLLIPEIIQIDKNLKDHGEIW